ncbi:MAG TPA: PilZ domain-containing protein [Deltaproteobacteria bacterium]|nr:PilZ domain-containing protein [Deltaproteobacteria bacterium]
MSKEAMVGLEFEVTGGKGPPEKEVTRCYFRVPVRNSDRFSIRIGKIVYPVVNINASGVAFRIKTGGEYFPVEKERIKATLTLDNQVFDVQAQVTHVSDDGEGKTLCGLHFIDLEKVTAEAFSASYEVLRERLLMNKGGST